MSEKEKAFTEELLNLLCDSQLGERSEIDVVNLDTGEIIISAGTPVSKRALKVIAEGYPHIRISTGSVRDGVMRAFLRYAEKLARSETKSGNIAAAPAKTGKAPRLVRLPDGTWVNAGEIKSIRPIMHEKTQYGYYGPRVIISYGSAGCVKISAKDDAHAVTLADEIAALVNDQLEAMGGNEQNPQNP